MEKSITIELVGIYCSIMFHLFGDDYNGFHSHGATPIAGV